MLDLIQIYLIMSLIGMLYILINYKKFGPWYYSAFLIGILFFMGMIYPLLFTISTTVIFEKSSTLFIFKVSIMIAIISLGFLNLNYDILFGIKYIKFLPTFFIGFMGGLIYINLLSPNSIQIIQSGNNYYYILDDYTLLINAICQYFLIAYFSYIEIKIMKNVERKRLKFLLFYLSIQFSITIVTFSSFLITHNFLIAHLHLIWLGIGILNAYGVLLFYPNFLVTLTHKITNLVIFLKSGVLIFSYDFQKKCSINSEVLKGSILIGISHTIANYEKRQERIRVIKTDQESIIFDYNPKGEYGLLILANKKSQLLLKSLTDFMNSFYKSYSHQLESIKTSSNLFSIQDMNIKEIIQDNLGIFFDKDFIK